MAFNPNSMLHYAGKIGGLLREEFPAVDEHGDPKGDFANYIPLDKAEFIGDCITLCVAEILQAWLDAGSERDVTMEELGPVMIEHVKGWACRPKEDSSGNTGS